MTLLFALAAAGLLYWAIKNGHIKLEGGQVAQLARTMGGYALIGLGISSVATGKIIFAVPLVLGGLWLLGFLKIPGFLNFSSSTTPSQRSDMLDISIDPATGRVIGAVTKGVFAGRALDSLSQPECRDLLEALNAADQAGLRLFAVYLDGRFPGWREDLQGGAHAGTGGKARPGVMTHEEAHKILGLAAGAGEAAVREAHRRLMLKLHPDVGGSNALAALVNEAKDVLLRRHR